MLNMLIRGTGALFALWSVSCGLIFTVTFFVVLLWHDHAKSTVFWPILLLVLVFIVTVFALFGKIGWDMLRKPGATAVSNFAFIFSFFATVDIYSLLPPDLATTYGSYPEKMVILNREIMALLVFVLFWLILKPILLRVTGFTNADSAHLQRA
jgi:hypothetical protein